MIEYEKIDADKKAVNDSINNKRKWITLLGAGNCTFIFDYDKT